MYIRPKQLVDYRFYPLQLVIWEISGCNEITTLPCSHEINAVSFAGDVQWFFKFSSCTANTHYFSYTNTSSCACTPLNKQDAYAYHIRKQIIKQTNNTQSDMRVLVMSHWEQWCILFYFDLFWWALQNCIRCGCIDIHVKWKTQERRIGAIMTLFVL